MDNELKSKCICPGCPTYAECVAKNRERLFCMEGKASCKLEKYGCICESCSVQKIKGFSGMYFCINGKAKLK